MTRISALLAGTALAALMATAAGAAPTPFREPNGLMPQASPLLLAQAEETEEERLRRLQQEQQEQAPQPEAAPPAEEQVAPPPAEEPAPPPPEPAPPPATEETPPAVEPAPEPAPAPAPPPAVGEPAAPPPEAPAEQPPAPQAPAVEQPAPEAPPPAPEAPPAPDQTPAAEPNPEAPAAEQPAPDQPEAPAQPTPPTDAAPEQPPAPEPKPEAPAEQPAVQPEPAQPAPPADAAPAQPAEPSAPQSGEVPPQQEAPILDSQKVPPPAPDGNQPPAPETASPAEPAAPPPATDAEAQPAAPATIESATAEKGKRSKRAPDESRRERPGGAEVLREIGDRIILELGGGQILVESSDRPRMTRGARDVFYEDLPRGRSRETVVRRDGTQVVTIRDAYGDIIRRSRITPDGREYVLVYVEEDNFDRVREWRDPGLDLPPMRLNIPRDEYILDAGRAGDADAYYDFLDQPPVERVERLYSVDEVKRSARIRDKVRRVELDTVNFGFGSADIDDAEIAKLDNVAVAMERLLAENPAETFLVEGHTDAVGSDVANLALSDRRAEAVADALTSVFDIPPENLATQGYGEQYLKVRTEAPERENRRVAIRRITPLVAPVANAN